MGKRYVLANGADFYSQSQSTEFKIIGSTGNLYSNNVPVNYYEALACGSSELPTLKAYGVSKITALAGANSSALTINIDAPIYGVMKTIIVQSTADLAGNMNLDLGSGRQLAMGASTDPNFRYISFSTLGTMQSLSLVGLTTAEWGLVAQVSTGGVWTSATGIRASTTFSS